MTPGGHPGQHALDDERVEQVGRAECLPGVEFDLGAGRRAAPRAFGLDLTAAEAAEPGVVPCQFPTRSAAPILACLSPITWVSSAVIIWCITTSPVAEAKASSPSLIAPATSARATVRLERQKQWKSMFESVPRRRFCSNAHKCAKAAHSAVGIANIPEITTRR